MRSSWSPIAPGVVFTYRLICKQVAVYLRVVYMIRCQPTCFPGLLQWSASLWNVKVEVTAAILHHARDGNHLWVSGNRTMGLSPT